MGIAALAQSVEQLLRKEKVDSSSPSSGTKIKNLAQSAASKTRVMLGKT